VYGPTREDVRRQLTKLLEQADQGIPVAAESWTLAKYLAYWLEHVVKPERKPRTYQGYEGVVRLYLILSWATSAWPSWPPAMCGSLSPVSGPSACAANTALTPPVRSRNAAHAQAASVASHGSPYG
jgi:hypothetical protein